jgi:histidine triad (HIT) family protein
MTRLLDWFNMVQNDKSVRNIEEECGFCSLIKREVESYIVFEDDVSLAFLDHRPLFHGHCLLIPKTDYETLIDLPADLIPLLFRNVQVLTRAM